MPIKILLRFGKICVFFTLQNAIACLAFSEAATKTYTEVSFLQAWKPGSNSPTHYIFGQA